MLLLRAEDSKTASSSLCLGPKEAVTPSTDVRDIILLLTKAKSHSKQQQPQEVLLTTKRRHSQHDAAAAVLVPTTKAQSYSQVLTNATRHSQPGV